jgi:nucleotide-binding universal stress UspA family protein
MTPGFRNGATIEVMARIARVIYPADFSSASRRAFATAVSLAKSNRATLTIVHVVVPIVPLVPEQYLDTATWARIDTQARQWGNQRLARLAERARKKGVRVATLLLEGDPSQHIVRAARSTHADFIVMGTHGRRGWSRVLLGSVAARVVATAPCPVVTVRGK